MLGSVCNKISTRRSGEIMVKRCAHNRFDSCDQAPYSGLSGEIGKRRLKCSAAGSSPASPTFF
ncbi:gp43 [Erwinia phage vB_EamM-Y2]|uniref:Gp43 n=1 Tax=Erwinia phage vB_EamM-Y2 TaxID=1051676 RepID=G0YPZ2_9CAUD|nr:gp43 [Erwinia phage vB_EamM-Y2]AEJ81419.1 gp43 [Erwinia phage vB_EamM-Y2]